MQSFLFILLLLFGIIPLPAYADEIPSWIKNTAKWWGVGQISDNDFISGIQFLISSGLLSVNPSIGGFDLSRAATFEGNRDAPFTIIMFTDHQCEKCAKWILHEKNILMKDIVNNGKSKFFILDYPFLGDDSMTAAEATYCAEDQGKFTEYHQLLSEKHNGIQTGWANHKSLISYAKELDLDTVAFDKCLFWDKYALRVDYNKHVANSHGVVGTPTFFIISPEGNFKRINGPQPPMIFDKIIKEMS